MTRRSPDFQREREKDGEGTYAINKVQTKRGYLSKYWVSQMLFPILFASFVYFNDSTGPFNPGTTVETVFHVGVETGIDKRDIGRKLVTVDKEDTNIGFFFFFFSVCGFRLKGDWE